jgi:hypothetical protein
VTDGTSRSVVLLRQTAARDDDARAGVTLLSTRNRCHTLGQEDACKMSHNLLKYINLGLHRGVALRIARLVNMLSVQCDLNGSGTYA